MNLTFTLYWISPINSCMCPIMQQHRWSHLLGGCIHLLYLCTTFII